MGRHIFHFLRPHEELLVLFSFCFVTDQFELLSLSLFSSSLSGALNATACPPRTGKMLVLLVFIIVFHITSATLLFIATINNVSPLSSWPPQKPCVPVS